MTEHVCSRIARLDPECTEMPTLAFDALIDVFFLVDILVTFNSGIIVSGEYIDDRRQVCWVRRHINICDED